MHLAHPDLFGDLRLRETFDIAQVQDALLTFRKASEGVHQYLVVLGAVEAGVDLAQP